MCVDSDARPSRVSRSGRRAHAGTGQDGYSESGDVESVRCFAQMVCPQCWVTGEVKSPLGTHKGQRRRRFIVSITSALETFMMSGAVASAKSRSASSSHVVSTVERDVEPENIVTGGELDSRGDVSE